MAKPSTSNPPLVQIIAGGVEGGSERYFCQLSIALANKGVKQVLITRPYFNTLAELKHPNISIKTARLGSPKLDFISKIKVKKIIQKTQPKFVISWLKRGALFIPPSNPAEAPKNFAIRSIASRNPHQKGSDRSNSQNHNPNRYTHIGRLDDYFNLKHYKTAHSFIAVSPLVGQHIINQDKAVAKVTQSIPNLIPIPSPKKYKPYDQPTILALGRFHPRKGFDTLIRAVARLPSEVRLVICGGKGEAEHGAYIKSLPKQLGIASRVKFLGWRSDPSVLMKKSTVVALPSRIEPFGLVFGEAWAHKKPLVATKTDGPLAHVEHRKTGMLCEIENVESLTKALREVLENRPLAQKLARNGYKQWQQTLHPEPIIKQWLRLLEVTP